MESVIISRKKLYFIFSAPTNIFNNIVISDEKYKYNKILNECIIGNQEGLKGEMYSILLFSDAYLTEDIKDPNITIKVTYNKEGNEELVFIVKSQKPLKNAYVINIYVIIVFQMRKILNVKMIVIYLIIIPTN